MSKKIIEKAVMSVMRTRIALAQKSYEEGVVEIDEVAAKSKEDLAEKLANTVLNGGK